MSPQVQGTKSTGKWLAGGILLVLAYLGPFIIFQRINAFVVSMGGTGTLPTDPVQNWYIGASVALVVFLLWVYVFGISGPGFRLHVVGGKK